MEKKQVNFEKELKRLQEIVSKMQSDDIELDESLKLYEEGQKIIALLNEELKNAEEKIENIVAINKK